MVRGLRILNTMPRALAEASLLRCCGSGTWAREMAATRPYESVQRFRDAADHSWWRLDEEEWLAAFASHPAIGGSGGNATAKSTSRWSADEQSGTRGIDDSLSDRLAEANAEYRERFGFTFIICATGKDAPQMLSRLEERLGNPREVEIRVAAEEQSQITQIRLTKLLSELEEKAEHA